MIDALVASHHAVTFRDNISLATVVNAMVGSGSYIQAMAAAILTLGGLHAPLVQTMRFLSLEDPAAEARARLAKGELIPGWGGSFQKDGPDPAFKEVADLLPAKLAQKIDEVTAVLHVYGKRIYPNPSAYTAATAISLGLPEEMALYLFLAGRLRGWTEIAIKAKRQGVH